MPKLIPLEASSGNKTYATRERAIAAVEKRYPDSWNGEPCPENTSLRYIVYQHPDTGRFFPVFIGDSAIRRGVHFNFHVVN